MRSSTPPVRSAPRPANDRRACAVFATWPRPNVLDEEGTSSRRRRACRLVIARSRAAQQERPLPLVARETGRSFELFASLCEALELDEQIAAYTRQQVVLLE